MAALTVAMTSRAEAAALDAVDPGQTQVFGGDFVQPCGWPTTVSLEGQCTGTLIHPQVVIYAAHCGAGYSSVQFGEEISPGHSRSVATEFCRTYPGYGPPGTDWALCVLSEPQDDIAIVPPLMGCEVDVLQNDTPVTIVGFGDAETGYGDKKEVTTGFGFIQANEAFLGGDGQDACFGDSGGPVFVQMPDSGSWRVFGITSYGSQNCMEGGYYSLMHVGMDWFESESGFDLTPCHNAAGDWTPSPDCGQFPMEPASSGGSWGDGCTAGPLSAPESTCGGVFDPDGDQDAPTVAFTSPANESRFSSDPETGVAMVTVDVMADDGTGYGVDTVELRVDGMSISGGVLDSAPYSYPLNLPSGTYVFEAVAVDLSGNEAVSEPLYIGVDMDAEVPVDPVGDSGSGSGGVASGGTGANDDAGSSGDGPLEPTGSSGDPGADGDDAGGCGCRSHSTPRPGLLLLGLWGLAALRRRRR